MSYDERWAQGRILTWMNETIQQLHLPFDGADQELKIKLPAGRKYPDFVIWQERRNQRIATIIELKQPFTDAYDDELVQNAALEATELGTYFFATWNINKLVLWETFRPGTRLIDRRLQWWEVAEVKTVRDLLRPEVERKVRGVIAEFLKTLAAYLQLKAKTPTAPVIPLLRPDDIFAFRLKSAVDSLYILYSIRLEQSKTKQVGFNKELKTWFALQGWLFTDQEEDFDRAARQAVYLLINKILFYNVLKAKHGLTSLSIVGITKGEEVHQRLQESFNAGTRLGYGVIFASDFVEKIPVPDEASSEISRLIEELNRYDFSKIGYDVVGRIFEKLIPPRERHKLGQYFTRSDVVDMMLGFTLTDAKSTLFDPACGSGTYLVRAYSRKKYLASRMSHDDILDDLWGGDISKFPAHLSVINLMIRNLASDKRPNIVARDFFDLEPGKVVELYEISEGARKLVKPEEAMGSIPDQFDVVVTNPPYTRQEEMEDLLEPGYKERVAKRISARVQMDIGKRASIFAYFFFWSTIFLQPGGRMSLITSNSWLDADFGKHMQELFLRDYYVVAIIEPKVEKFFPDADIATCITVLERKTPGQRKKHLVKFVQLKKDLREIIPEPSESLSDVQKEAQRWKSVDEFVALVTRTRSLYEDDAVRVFTIDQDELFEEGFDKEVDRYVGSKWGKYIRAPDIFFEILSQGAKRGLWVPLKTLAGIKRGYTTGANEFFYLEPSAITNWKIESKFLRRLVKSPRFHNRLIITKDQLNTKVLLVEEPKSALRGTNVLSYIKWGEEQHFNERDMCASRARGQGMWYQLGEKSPSPLLFPANFFSRHLIYLNESKASADKRLYELYPKKGVSTILLAAILNSTLYALLALLYGRSPGGGRSVEVAVYEAASLPIINPDGIPPNKAANIRQAFSKLLKREIKPLEEEMEDEDRLALDRAVFELLGMGDKEIKETYKAILEIERILAARDKMKAKSKKQGVSPEDAVKYVLTLLSSAPLPKDFPNGYLTKGTMAETFKVESRPVHVEFSTDVAIGYSVKTDGETVYSGWDLDRARYIFNALSGGKLSFEIPVDPEEMKEAASKYESDLRTIVRQVESIIDGLAMDRKMREAVEPAVLKQLLGNQNHSPIT